MSRVEHGPLKRVGRVVAAFAAVGAGILSPDPIDIGQAAIQEVLNSLKGRPDRTAQAGPFSTTNWRLSRVVDAQGNLTYRLFIPIALREVTFSGAAALPNGTPTPEPTATPTRTPTPTATPEACSPWPAEMAYLVANLPGLSNLCYVRYTSPDQAPAGLRGVGVGWDPEHIYYISDGSSPDGTYALGHEGCHRHQLMYVRQDGLDQSDLGDKYGDTRVRNWPTTSEGKDYAVASQQVVSEAQASGKAMPWPNFGQDLIQDFANICRHAYIHPAEGADWLRSNGWDSLRQFVKRWLPGNTIN